MKIGAIIQARMSSQRCPGKVLRDLAGQPVLAHVTASLASCSNLSGLCVATSQDPSDDVIAEFCQQAGIGYFRGSLENVAQRFAEALSSTDWDAFVRISADSPLIDHRVVTQAVNLMAEDDKGNHCWDLVTNVFPRSFPKGQSVEVIRSETFHDVVSRLTTDHQREHVTPYFYENPAEFNIHNFTTPLDFSTDRLTIDTEQDFEIMMQVATSLSRPLTEYPWDVLRSLAHDYRQQAMGVPL